MSDRIAKAAIVALVLAAAALVCNVVLAVVVPVIEALS